MWSELQPNGKVKFVERYEHPLTGKLQKVSVTLDKETAVTRKQAQKALDMKIDHKLRELCSVVKKDDLRLSELIDLYRKDQEATVSKSTYQRNYFATKALMQILGENTLVERLSAGYVRERLASLNEKPGTTNERITRLKALIRWGYENDYIDDIRWLDKVKKFKDEEKLHKLEEKYLESSELKTLLESLSVEKWRFLTELTALSGLRIGEAIALHSEDADIRNRIIRVNKTYDPVNEIITSPKTASSNREVYMQDELLGLCRRINLFMKKERLAIGYQSEIFISNSNGGYMSYYAYNKCLRENAEKLLGKSVTTHFMRHTHVSLMAEQGVSLDVISRRLGHTDSKITRDIYFHVTKKMREKDNAAVTNIRLL